MPKPVPPNPYDLHSYGGPPRDEHRCHYPDCNAAVDANKMLCDWHNDPRPSAT